MSLTRLRIMWGFIIAIIVTLLYMPHLDDFTEPVEGKIMTPAKVERVQNYVGSVATFIVARCL